MRRLSIVGSSLLFAGCLSDAAEVVAEGEPCDTDGVSSCATAWPTDDAGYLCVAGAWAAQADCDCDDDGVNVTCVDTAIGFTGVTRAGAPRAAVRRLRRA